MIASDTSIDNQTIKILKVFVSYSGGVLLSFLFTIILAHLVDSEGAGIFFIAVTLVEVAATIARLGMENIVLRQAAIFYNQKKTTDLAVLYWKTIILASLSGGLVYFPFWYLGSHPPLLTNENVALSEIVPLIQIAIIPVALITILSSFFKAVGSSSIGTFYQTVLPPLLMVSGGVFLFARENCSVTDIAILYLITRSLTLLIAMINWHPKITNAGVIRWSSLKSISLIKQSLPMLLISCMSLVMGWTDILVLGAYSTPSETGVYGVSNRIAGSISLVLVAVNTVAAPRFAILHEQSNQKGLELFSQQCSKWMTLATIPVAVLLLAFPEWILLIYGEEFEQGKTTLRILALGQLINVITGSVGYLLMMTGNEKLMRNIILLAASINLLGNLVLVPGLGAIGAAISTALCLAFMNILAYIFVLKKIKVNTLGYLSCKS